MGRVAARLAVVAMAGWVGVLTGAIAGAQPEELPRAPWPGSKLVVVADPRPALGANISGVVVVDAKRAWAVRDDPGELLELRRSGSTFTLGASLPLRSGGGDGRPDAEAVTVVDGERAVYVGVERDYRAGSSSRNSILRVVVSGGTARTTAEWDLGSLLPPTSANQGVEGLAHIPDRVLVEAKLRDRSGQLYRPDAYPGHGTGLFVVGIEQTGELAFVALAPEGKATLVALLPSGLPAVMDLAWSAAWRQLWVQCDERCDGDAAVWTASPDRFGPSFIVEPPVELTGRNTEGLAFGPTCTGTSRIVLWSEDSATASHALRTSTLPCRGLGVTSTPHGSTITPRTST